MEHKDRPLPLYKSRSWVPSEDIANVLNDFYDEGYHLKEILPERVAARNPQIDPYDSMQLYTILVVRA